MHRLRALGIFTSFGFAIVVARPAAAQDPGPPQGYPPPAGYQPPPAGYAPPPAGYAPPPAGYVPAPGYGVPQPVYGAPPPGYYAPTQANLGPKTLDYDEGQPIPAGYHVHSKARTGLVIGGGVLFGVSYISSLFVALIGDGVQAVNKAGGDSSANSDRYAALFIPAVGPFIGMSTLHPDANGSAGLALDGIMQVGGIAMFIGGLAVPKVVLVRDDIGKPGITLTPVAVSPNRLSTSISF